MENSTVQAVVFDLDGTLVDSRGDIVASCLHMLRTHDLPALSPAEIASFVGDGAELLVARATRIDANSPSLKPLLATYLEYYAAHGHDHTVMMPGAEAALDQLTEMPLALCTFKPRATMEPLLDHLDLTQRFATIIAGEDVKRHKPHADPLIEIARRLMVPPEALVMVGDGPQDIEAGRNAGARTVGIPGPFLPRERLTDAHPHLLLESITELVPAIEHWQK